MTNQTPKAFDFRDEPSNPPEQVTGSQGPKTFDFGDIEVSAPQQVAPPKPLNFADMVEVPASNVPAKASPQPLFDSEDHPAVRDALALTRTGYPEVFAQYEQRLAALLRRILPVKLALVTDWAEEPLMEQAALLQPITDLVHNFSAMGVSTLLASALEGTQEPTGVLGKLFNRSVPPSEFKPMLIASRTELQNLMVDCETASHNLDASANVLTLHWVVLAVVSDLAGNAPDTTLLDALQQRRQLIQQAVRQAELSIMQMGQVRQQITDLLGQVSSFLTVTLPAVEMARTQKSH